MSKKMTKLTVDMVEQMLQENAHILENDSTFRNSPLAKAIKKKMVEPEVIVYVCENTDSWWIRDYCFMNCGFSYQDAALIGLLRVVNRDCEWTEAISQFKGFFTSTEEFLNFVKDNYDIDLTQEEIVLEEGTSYENFKFFAYGIIHSNGGYTFLSHKCANADLHRKFYIDSFAYLIKMCQYYDKIVKANPTTLAESMNSFSGRVWAVNTPVLKEMVAALPIKSVEKAVLLMNYAVKGFSKPNARLHAFEDNAEFHELLTTISNYIPATFPLIGKGMPYELNDDARQFSYQLFYYMMEKENSEKLTDEEKEFLFSLAVKGCLEPSRRALVADMSYSRHFISGAFNIVPKEKMFSLYKELTPIFGPANVLDGVTAISNSNKKFYPVKEITDLILERGTRWEYMIFPEELMYDMEYIEYAVSKLGKQGILFGGGYRGNQFVNDRLDPGKLPEEFFEKYGEYIHWDNLSYCRKISLDFLKKHKEQICFYNLRGSAGHCIDDELGEWLLSHKEEENYYAYNRALKCSKSLSPEFIMKNLEEIWDTGHRRQLTAARVDMKLADLVGMLA